MLSGVKIHMCFIYLILSPKRQIWNFRECQGVNNIPRGEGKGYICLKAKLTYRERKREKNTVVALSVRFFFLQVFKFSFYISRFIDSFE